METLFKRHFWVFHTAFLAVVAFMLATAVNEVAGHALSEALAGKEGTGAAPRAKVANDDRDFVAASESNIFDGKREAPVDPSAPEICLVDNDCAANEKCLPVEGGEPGEKTCQVELKPGEIDFANAVQSDLPLRLVGTSVFSVAEDSLASIVDQGGGRNAEAKVYSINLCEIVPEISLDDDEEDMSNLLPEPSPCKVLPGGHELLAIQLDRVYLQNTEKGHTEYILLEEAPDAPKVAKAAPTPRARKDDKKGDDDDEMGKGITKVGPNKYEVTRDELTGALGNMSKLATQARIVPAFEGGEAIGFKLFSIRPGSLYSKIGIQNGDIIQKVNGYEITSPDKALEIYQKLKDGAAFTVDVKRRGKPVTMDYTVTQ